MRRKLFHPPQFEPRAARKVLDRVGREIGEVLVVNRVELILLELDRERGVLAR
jgi:hypothetical protein